METTTNPSTEIELVDLAAINYNLYLAGTVKRADTGEDWTFDQAFEEIQEYINTLLSRKEEETRKDEKERILACGHAHEAINGFQPYGYIKNEELERHIFMDGFKDGRAMLMIDVMSKRDPRKPSK